VWVGEVVGPVHTHLYCQGKCDGPSKLEAPDLALVEREGAHHWRHRSAGVGMGHRDAVWTVFGGRAPHLCVIWVAGKDKSGEG
jgi:hypothetical protein